MISLTFGTCRINLVNLGLRIIRHKWVQTGNLRPILNIFIAIRFYTLVKISVTILDLENFIENYLYVFH